jgi:hypothetical protein
MIKIKINAHYLFALFLDLRSRALAHHRHMHQNAHQQHSVNPNGDLHSDERHRQINTISQDISGYNDPPPSYSEVVNPANNNNNNNNNNNLPK